MSDFVQILGLFVGLILGLLIFCSALVHGIALAREVPFLYYNGAPRSEVGTNCGDKISKKNGARQMIITDWDVLDATGDEESEEVANDRVEA